MSEVITPLYEVYKVVIITEDHSIMDILRYTIKQSSYEKVAECLFALREGYTVD